MKGLIIIALLVLVCVLIGWISFSDNGSTSTITIDKQEIRDDAQQAVESLERSADKFVETAREKTNGVQEPTHVTP